jgi:hypothetical protein
MRPVSYLGVTGLRRRRDCLTLIEKTPDIGRKIMLGVLASAKTLKGLPNSWPQRYPDVNQIAAIFPDHARALNLVHYNTKPDVAEPLHVQLGHVMDVAGINCHGLQLNIAWPEASELDRFLDRQLSPTIVLQVGGKAFKPFEGVGGPRRLAERVREYGKLVEYVLLDPSGGEGKALDGERLLPYVQELYEKSPDLGVGVAGGLSSETIDLMNLLWDRYPDLSIDAEGRLRDSPEDKVDGDRFNMEKALAYLQSAAQMCIVV